MVEESLHSKKHERDYGRDLGRSMVRACERVKSKMMRQANSETTSLLKDPRSTVTTRECDDTTRSHVKMKQASPPTYREVWF